MIKIKRAGCPKVLKGSPPTGKRYKNPRVKDTLRKMQHGKCCYCEQMLPEETVEHYYPQSRCKNRRNDWKNLLLACGKCNKEKDNNFPRDACGSPLIIDPSDPTIDPEEHIGFVVDEREVELGLPIAKNESDLGQTTIDEVGLYIKFYIDRRREFCIDDLLPAYLMLLKAEFQGEPRMLHNAKEWFAMFLSAKGKLAAFARAFARYKRVDTRFGINIPVGAELAGEVLRED